jgi:hypothetical protein
MGSEPNPPLDPDDARERLDELGDQIDEAKRNTRDEFEVPGEDELTYVDSGDTEAEDDQTIAPPG